MGLNELLTIFLLGNQVPTDLICYSTNKGSQLDEEIDNKLFLKIDKLAGIYLSEANLEHNYSGGKNFLLLDHSIGYIEHDVARDYFDDADSNADGFLSLSEREGFCENLGEANSEYRFSSLRNFTFDQYSACESDKVYAYAECDVERFLELAKCNVKNSYDVGYVDLDVCFSIPDNYSACLTEVNERFSCE